MAHVKRIDVKGHIDQIDIGKVLVDFRKCLFAPIAANFMDVANLAAFFRDLIPFLWAKDRGGHAVLDHMAAFDHAFMHRTVHEAARVVASPECPHPRVTRQMYIEMHKGQVVAARDIHDAPACPIRARMITAHNEGMAPTEAAPRIMRRISSSVADWL